MSCQKQIQSFLSFSYSFAFNNLDNGTGVELKIKLQGSFIIAETAHDQQMTSADFIQGQTRKLTFSLSLCQVVKRSRVFYETDLPNAKRSLEFKRKFSFWKW